MLPHEDLEGFIQCPVAVEFLAHVSHQAALVIPCDPATTMDQTATSAADTVTPPPLHAFISSLVKRSRVRTGTLLGTLVFLDRLEQRLSRAARGMPCTCHRIFLATLIVTSKALHDASPKNKHWAKYAMCCFSLPEINLMEKQLLSLLNYRVNISMDDLHRVFTRFRHYHTLVAMPSSSSSTATSLITNTSTNSSLSSLASSHSLSTHEPNPPPPSLIYPLSHLDMSCTGYSILPQQLQTHYPVAPPPPPPPPPPVADNGKGRRPSSPSVAFHPTSGHFFR